MYLKYKTFIYIYFNNTEKITRIETLFGKISKFKLKDQQKMLNRQIVIPIKYNIKSYKNINPATQLLRPITQFSIDFYDSIVWLNKKKSKTYSLSHLVYIQHVIFIQANFNNTKYFLYVNDSMKKSVPRLDYMNPVV